MKTSNGTTQVNGDHYENEIEPVHIIAEFKFDWFQGEILKYVSRHKRKNGISDLNKSIHICDIARDLHVDGDIIAISSKRKDLLNKYINQFPKEDQGSLSSIIRSLCEDSWVLIRDNLVSYKDKCYGEE